MRICSALRTVNPLGHEPSILRPVDPYHTEVEISAAPAALCSFRMDGTDFTDDTDNYGVVS